MTPSIHFLKPKLRPLDPRPARHEGRPYFLLRDPLGLSSQAIMVPQDLAAALPYLDGTRDAAEVKAALAIRLGLRVSETAIDELVAALDSAYLLDNERAAAAAEEALEAYRSAPFRPPALAGGSYPLDPSELEQALLGFMDEAGGDVETRPAPERITGLVSPHIDYARGGKVYARVWKTAEEMVRAADLVVLLGTDHYAGGPTLTLTRQDYATPFGILPTDQAAVDLLVDELGEERVFGEELHHRHEHSLELAAVWLHFIRDRDPCSLLPVLCGSFTDFIQARSDPAEDPPLAQAIRRLRDYCAGRRVVVVAAGDLAHVGPAFGGLPLDFLGRARQQASDEQLIERICTGDAEGFFQAISQVDDRNNVCGLAPIYLAMQLLSPATGLMVDYDLCPADEAGTSVVSICGVVFEGGG